MHTSSSTYTRSLSPSKQTERNRRDVAHNIVRPVVNAGLAAKNLIHHMFNVGHHIDYISSRHQQRKDARPEGKKHYVQWVLANGDAAALETRQAEAAKDPEVVAFNAALAAFGEFSQKLKTENTEELRTIALDAIENAEAGLLDQDLFKKGLTSGIPTFPDNAVGVRCRALIGQAWIKTGRCVIEGANVDFEIPTGRGDVQKFVDISASGEVCSRITGEPYPWSSI